MQLRMQWLGPWAYRWAALMLIGLAAGCVTHASRKGAAPVFYPPAPDQPRIQYLASYSTSDDLGDRNWLLDFLIGRQPPRSIGKPYGVAATRGRLYVADTSPAVLEILDLSKHKLRYWAPRGEGRLGMPTNLALDNDGTLYVADVGRGQVLIFGPDERFAGAIGVRQAAPRTVHGPGSSADGGSAPPAQALAGAEQPITIATPMKPADVALAGHRLYVADVLTHSVRVFDKQTRQQLLVIPADRKDENATLYTPTNLDVDQAGRIYVSDTGGFRIQQYDAEGKYLRTFGRQGDSPGEHVRPKGVAVDRAGRVYVVDAAAQVVQIFDAEGRILMYFGEPNEDARSLVLPAGIAIDYENVDWFQSKAAPGFRIEYLVIVVSQYGTGKINIYGFLQPR